MGKRNKQEKNKNKRLNDGSSLTIRIVSPYHSIDVYSAMLGDQEVACIGDGETLIQVTSEMLYKVADFMERLDSQSRLMEHSTIDLGQLGTAEYSRELEEFQGAGSSVCLKSKPAAIGAGKKQISIAMLGLDDLNRCADLVALAGY